MRASAGKRVLMLLENNPYPQDPRVHREATALENAGYHVSIICPADPGQKRIETIDGVEVYRYPAPPEISSSAGYVIEYAYSLVAMFLISLVVAARRGFDVIHAHNPPDVLVVIGAFFKLFGKKFIFDHHDLSPEMYDARFKNGGKWWMRRVLVIFEKLSCRTADHVIATNESYKEVEMRRSRVPADRITVVRNGPDLKRLRVVSPDPELRARAGTLIGYVGRMGVQDGVDYFIRALNHLVNDLGHTDVCAVIIGRGDAVPDLKTLTTQLGLDDHVWFPGLISEDQLRRYLSTVDICVDPDPSNPFNDRSTMIKMMEYMVFGKPIVAFDLPEHRRSAKDAAVYVRPNDEFEFAKAIANLIEDPARRAELGKYGRERVVNELTWQQSVPHLLSAYDAVLSEMNAPASADQRQT